MLSTNFFNILSNEKSYKKKVEKYWWKINIVDLMSCRRFEDELLIARSIMPRITHPGLSGDKAKLKLSSSSLGSVVGRGVLAAF